MRFSRKCNPFLFTLWILVVGVLVIIAYEAYQITHPLSSNKDNLTVNIPKGATVNRIGSILSDSMNSSKRSFNLLAFLRGDATKLQAGSYALNASLSLNEVYRHLLTGENAISITIPEGSTSVDIARILMNRQLIGTEEDFLSAISDPFHLHRIGYEGMFTLEGFLFPDTYRIDPGTSVNDIVTMFVRQFQKKIEIPLFVMRHVEEKKCFEVIILASLIEKEAVLNEEKPLIASVYTNRLKKKMRLDCDATVRYTLHKWTEPLTKEDLKTESPYNTYIHYGLPPAPICNPGTRAVEAALYPATTRYLYYCAKGDGAHVFSTNLTEHNKAVRQYLRTPAKRKE